jgi:hypothetical protein
MLPAQILRRWREVQLLSAHERSAGHWRHAPQNAAVRAGGARRRRLADPSLYSRALRRRLSALGGTAYRAPQLGRGQ